MKNPAFKAVLTFVLAVFSISISKAETRAIAKLAFIYGFPVVESCKTLYSQAIDKDGPDFKAPLNEIGNTARVFTAKDRAFVTPNSDTPYSFVWMDLRANPWY